MHNYYLFVQQYWLILHILWFIVLPLPHIFLFTYFTYMKTLTIGDLKARIPIIQGGMGVGISLSGLASAVANEGGIGVISAAGLGLLYKKLSPNYKIGRAHV